MTDMPGPDQSLMAEAGVSEDRTAAEPVAVGPGDSPGAVESVAPVDAGASAAASGDVSLLALIDRLTATLERTELGELEVMAGGTTIVLRAPSAVERPVVIPAVGETTAPAGAGPTTTASAAGTPPSPAPAARPSVRAPLTGIYYGAPSPGATPYVAVGDHVAVGQIIGLIEAMKLFNEIKSDLAGRVVRICADNGALVKAKQPLIEVEPA
jgi:acetyl-CoA carboxylase biotin carboxyl carrier protein